MKLPFSANTCYSRDFEDGFHAVTLGTPSLKIPNDRGLPYIWANCDNNHEAFLVYFNDEWHEAQSIDFNFYPVQQ